MMRWLMALALAIACAAAAFAVRGDGWRTLYETRLQTMAPAPGADSEILVSGFNPATVPVPAWLRIDDSRSSGYAERVNERLHLLAGEFRVRIPLASLRTPSGRALERERLEFLLLFAARDAPALERVTVAIVPAAGLARGASGWDLGPADGAVFPGFRAVVPGDPQLEPGPGFRALRRPGGDALTGDGMRGLARFSATLAPGRWRISLWLEDTGEWEFLPHALRRAVRVNGHAVLARNLSPRQWIREVYLRGRQVEPWIDGNAWEVLGARRGGLVSLELELADGALDVRLEGAAPDANYLAAVLAEPVGSGALEQVQQQRAQRFGERWQIDPPEPGPAATQTVLWCLADGDELRPDSRAAAGDCAAATAVAAPGTSVTLDFAALGGAGSDLAPALLAQAPRRDGWLLGTELRFGHWRYRRSDSLLRADPDHLRSDLGSLRLDPRVPRRLNLRIVVPPDAPAGTYAGSLSLRAAGEERRVALSVRVLAIELPPAPARVGVFHESLPFHDWFDRSGVTRRRADACDYRTLRGMGLAAIAPALASPADGHASATVGDLALAEAAGFPAPLVAYTPLRRLMSGGGLDAGAAGLATLERERKRAGLAAPLWIVADEPSNPGMSGTPLATVLAALRRASPEARLGAFLNAPADLEHIPGLDSAFVNDGVGDIAGAADAARRNGRELWLYNMSAPRLAAGFFALRVGAIGYLQWHARMPTADPFDPTDGREGDYQLLYPQLTDCAAPSDVDARLLALADAVTDQRWAAWLERQAGVDARARALRDEWLAAVPRDWRRIDEQAARTLPRLWRQRIVALALELDPP